MWWQPAWRSVLLALPAAANAAVTSNVNGGLLTVTSDAADAITITCVANAVQVNGASPARRPARL